MYVHFVTGKCFQDSRIREINPFPPPQPRSRGREIFIYQSRKPPLDATIAVEEGGPRRRVWTSPLFPAEDADVRRWLGNCGLAVPTHMRTYTTPGLPTSKAVRYNHLSFARPSFEPRACAPWTKDSLAGLRCIHGW